MPRLIDKLDAAVGRTPPALDLGIDYLTRRPGPPALIGEDGAYSAGWYESFEGRFNPEDSSAFGLAMQRWFHVSLDTPRHFINLNIADLAKAGNVALLVADKETGAFEQASVTHLFQQNSISVSEDLRCFEDPRSHSFVKVDPGEERFTFSLHADHLHVSGVARRAIAPPFVQITRFQRGRGSLQWYGNLALEHGTLTLGREVTALPAGARGLYDRTIGHQRGIQSWNWVAASGTAVDEETGEVVPIGVQVARDRPAARPAVESKKHVVWLDGVVHKIPSADFRYGYLDAEARQTTEWHIVSPQPGDSWLDLTFQPRFQRRERQQLVLVSTDFNQYYGALSGRLRVAGKTLVLQEMFAVTEESLMEI
jgi:hypothetical protein